MARRGGLARTYRDPRFDRFRSCPACSGTATGAAEKPCDRCGGPAGSRSPNRPCRTGGEDDDAVVPPDSTRKARAALEYGIGTDPAPTRSSSHGAGVRMAAAATLAAVWIALETAAAVALTAGRPLCWPLPLASCGDAGSSRRARGAS